MIKKSSKKHINKPMSENVIVIEQNELPLVCPSLPTKLWNMHPKVFLPLDKVGEAVCPYCGAKYVLKEKTV